MKTALLAPLGMRDTVFEVPDARSKSLESQVAQDSRPLCPNVARN